jgi:predicted transport protein
MEEKLLFEVDLSSDKEGSINQRAQILEQLSRTAISEGALDARGEEVFTDKRVRDALASLASKRSKPLIDAVAKEIGKPPIAPEYVAGSLVRVVTGQQPAEIKKPAAPGKKSPSDYIKKEEYSLDQHLAGKPASIIDLFERLDEFARGLSNDIGRRIRKQYVAYFAGKRSFFTLEPRKARIIVYLNLDPTTAKPWNDGAMRDVRKIGHYGMGDTEYSLTQSSQVAEVQELIGLALERTRA